MRIERMILNCMVLLATCFNVSLGQEAKDENPPAYDAELAQQLGADDYGMRSYVFVMLTSGDADTADQEASSKAFAGHFANMKKMAADGKLILAGPFNDKAGVKRGLFVLNVTDLEQAKKLVESDPAVAAGYLKYELTPWYGSAALMQIPDTHARIAKVTF